MADQTRSFEITGHESLSPELERIAAAYGGIDQAAADMAQHVGQLEDRLAQITRTTFATMTEAQQRWRDKLTGAVVAGDVFKELVNGAAGFQASLNTLNLDRFQLALASAKAQLITLARETVVPSDVAGNPEGTSRTVAAYQRTLDQFPNSVLNLRERMQVAYMEALVGPLQPGGLVGEAADAAMRRWMTATDQVAANVRALVPPAERDQGLGTTREELQAVQTALDAQVATERRYGDSIQNILALESQVRANAEQRLQTLLAERTAQAELTAQVRLQAELSQRIARTPPAPPPQWWQAGGAPVTPTPAERAASLAQMPLSGLSDAEMTAHIERQNALYAEQNRILAETKQRLLDQVQAAIGTVKASEGQLTARQKLLDQERRIQYAIEVTKAAMAYGAGLGTPAGNTAVVDLGQQLGPLESRLTSVQTKLASTGDEMTKTGARARESAVGVGHLGRALENVLVYGGLYSVFNRLTTSIGEFFKGISTGAGDEEKFVATTGRMLNSAVDARHRIQAVYQQSLALDIPLKELESFDQKLAQLGVTAQTAQQRFGLSLTDLRQAMADLSQAPGISSSEVEEFFARSADGANRLALSLASAGITTRDELIGYGVQFDKTGNSIISSTNVTTQAVLAIWRKHYGDLSSLTAVTWDGVQTRTANLMNVLQRELGRDVFAQFSARLDAILKQASAPQGLTGIEAVGMSIGAVFEGATTASDRLSSAFIHVITNLVPGMQQAFAPFLANMDLGITAMEKAQSAARRAADGFDDITTAVSGTGLAMAAATAQADTFKQSIAGLQFTLNEAQDSMAEVEANYTKAITPLQDAIQKIQDAESQQRQQVADAIAPVQDRLKGLQRDAEQLRTKYEAQLVPLKAAEESLRRQYESTQLLNQMTVTAAQVAKDKVLAANVYTDVGREAALRLPREIAQLQQEQAHQKYNTDLQGLQDKEAGLKTTYDTAAGANKATQEAAQGAIDRLNAAAATLIRAEDTQIAGIKAQMRPIEDAYKTAKQQLTDLENTLKKQIKDLQEQSSGAVKTNKNLTNDALLTFRIGLDSITAALTAVGSAYKLLGVGSWAGGGTSPPAPTGPEPLPSRAPGVSPAAPTNVYGPGGGIPVVINLVVSGEFGNQIVAAGVRAQPGLITDIVLKAMKGGGK